MNIENEKKTFNESLAFMLFALTMAVVSWWTYVEVTFYTSVGLFSSILFPSPSSLLFHFFGYFVCCIVFCLPWFWIRSQFLTEQSGLYLVKLISWTYLVIIFGIVFFFIAILGIGVSGISSHWGSWLEKWMNFIVEGMTLGFSIALLAMSIACFSIMTYHTKAWILLVGNFFLALACLGARLAIVHIAYLL